MTRKTGCDIKAIGCWLVPSTCMLDKGWAIMWIEIEVKVIWCSHIRCARGFHIMDGIVDSEVECSIEGDEVEHCCETEVVVE